MTTKITRDDKGQLKGDYYEYIVGYGDRVSVKDAAKSNSDAQYYSLSFTSITTGMSNGSSLEFEEAVDLDEAEEIAAEKVRDYGDVVIYQALKTANLPVAFEDA